MHVYNELDPYAAQWLRNLCDRNLIAPGRVDERSIRDLTPDDVAGPGQRHFFAGIGGWSVALRMAGWPDELDVWTGSCPCQPFSVAGKRAGKADDRHLWPAWFELIRVCGPAIIFGEQVASKDALEWLDAVFADLEGAGYACGAADLCAAGVGAPHIRQRLWWVGVRMADTTIVRLEGDGRRGDSRSGRQGAAAERGGCDGWLGHPSVNGARQHARELSGHEGKCEVWAAHGNHASVATGAASRPGPVNGAWRYADWLYCRDDKWRPVESRTFPLAHGVPGRVGRLRAYGNAIVPAVGAAFIQSVMDWLP